MYKNCQSCSMPLKNDPSGGSTNADGSRNEMYCGYCYQKGEFVNPDLKVEQMQEIVRKKMKEMGFIAGLFAGMFANQIPKLKRWSNK